MIKKILLTALSLGLPLISLAQEAPNSLYKVKPPLSNPNDILTLFNTIIDWLFTFLLVLAVVFILVAAFYYLTSSGSEEKVGKAHKTLFYAAVAIAVAVLSQGIVFVIRSILR